MYLHAAIPSEQMMHSYRAKMERKVDSQSQVQNISRLRLYPVFEPEKFIKFMEKDKKTVR